VSTTTAYALRTAAAAIDSPIRDVLVRAAEAHESTRWQPRASAARRQWRVLVHLSDQRAALERAGGADAAEQRRGIDERIEASSRELGLVPGDPNPSSHLGTPTDATAASDGGAKPGATATEQDREACTDSGLSTEPTPPTPEAGSPDELDIRIEESAPVAEARTVPPTEA
jgi:hypothetical protein